MGTISCHSNQSSYPTGTKNTIIRSPDLGYRCYMCNMERIGLTVSEEMSFENFDGQTTDGRRVPLYTKSSPIELNQRTNGPVNAHLISWPSKAQNIQNLKNIW